MARYIKRPIVIEAYKLFEKDIPGWYQRALENGTVQVKSNNEIIVTTLEGEMRCEEGDYIVQGVRGELYPCNGDIFAQTYMVADE